MMLEAVNSVHDRLLVHSDLKPANFVFVGDGGWRPNYKNLMGNSDKAD